MSRNWEQTLRDWSKPPSDYEDSKRDRTESEIRAALRAHPSLAQAPIRIFAKGSYKNNTNVRLDYDVDIAAEYHGFFFHDNQGAGADIVKAAARIQPYKGTYTVGQFKNDVEAALVARFGRSAVTRGNMAMRVRERKTTLPADVVPCFEYHLIYGSDYAGNPVYHQGTRIYPDRGTHIHNWPQQHYDRGVSKNDSTGGRFKRMVRALKCMENELVDNGVIKDLAGFFIESLVYNVSNDTFRSESYVDTMKRVLASMHSATETDERCKEWVEVNERKYLFHPTQQWTRAEANELALAGWRLLAE